MIEQSVPPESYYFKKVTFSWYMPYGGGPVQRDMGACLGTTEVMT